MASARRDNRFFEPLPDAEDPSHPFLRKGGLLSFHSIAHLRGEMLKQLIDVLYVGKYGI